MAINDDEWKRLEALYAISFRTRCGAVEGVEFDFRHELLDPTEWQMRDAIGTGNGDYAYGRRPGLPFVWFPWYGEFNKDDLQKEIDDYFKAESAHTTNVNGEPRKPKSKAEYRREFTPDCIVCSGDKLVIDYVKIANIDDEFSHLHDAELRFAYCKVIRPNGKTIKACLSG